MVAIVVTSELSCEGVVSKFKNNFVSINESKQTLRKSMHSSGDIRIEKISVSLRCQFYGSRMKLPVRSRLCTTHIQPFELTSFVMSCISSKESRRKWICPICNKRAYDLVIDKYILEMMNLNPTANEIIFNEKGEP